MADDNDPLASARECFRQAADAAKPESMRLLVELGMEYLRIAQGDAHLGDEIIRDGARARLH